MVAWFKWLLKSDIGTILQHRPTAFALVMIPAMPVGVAIIDFFVVGHGFVFLYMPFILFPILIFLMYVLLQNPIKIFLASIPGLVLGHFLVMLAPSIASSHLGIDTYIEALLIFPFGFVLGTIPVVSILLIWYLWQIGDLWLKAIGIPLLLISLSPSIIWVIRLVNILGIRWGYWLLVW